MNKSNMDKLVVELLNKVKIDDSKLLENDVHEITFVFRFAHYLANIIENTTSYKVDIEYNRDKSNVKRIDNKIRRVDLIVHQRATNDNLIAIEFKKGYESETDKSELEKLKIDYCYKNIYFIDFKLGKIETYNNNEWVYIQGGYHE